MTQAKRISGERLSQEKGYDPYKLAEALRNGVRAWHVDSLQPVVDVQNSEEGYSFLFMPHSLPAQSEERDNWEKEILAFEFSTDDICRFEQEEKEFDDAFNDERREDARRDLEQAERRLEIIKGGDDQFDSVAERAKRDDAREWLRELDIEDAKESLRHWKNRKATTDYEREIRDWSIQNALEVLNGDGGDSSPSLLQEEDDAPSPSAEDVNIIWGSYRKQMDQDMLSPPQKRNLEAAMLRSQGIGTRDIFSKLQPDDKKQKDPRAASRRWIREGKALAKRLGLPPLPAP